MNLALVKALVQDFKDAKINAEHRQFDRKLSLLSFYSVEQNPVTYSAPMIIPDDVMSPLVARSKLKLKSPVVSFGDSYEAFMAGEIDDVLPAQNIFNIPGLRARQITQTIRACGPNLRAQAKIVFVGTTGNDGLQYQPIENWESDLWNMLVVTRQEFPTAKICIVGLPPVYRVYPTKHSPRIELAMIRWMFQDGNSVVVTLRQLSGAFGIFPKARFTADGVHTTHQGKRKCAELFKRAINSFPGTVI